MTATPSSGTGKVQLDLADLHPGLRDPAMESMNFLNEVAGRYPDAISFAPGRPYEEFFEVEQVHDHLRRYERYLTDDRALPPEQVRRTLFQYGRTKGIVHEVVARYLETDEGIRTDPDALVITVGCQEAMYLVLRALRADEKDAVLAVAPSYVGLTGAARLVDMEVLPVASGPRGVDLDDLTATLHRARHEGLRPRACYVVPDFSNPTGVSLDLPTRRALLELAGQEDLLLLEDNPYGVFNAGGERPPTLKALDTAGQVVYLGSFAKTGFPGARVGFAVADQLVRIADGRTGLLADELSKIKSMVTVNTSPLSQAVIAGKLLEHGYSLEKANRREIEVYRDNLRRMLDGLAGRFPPDGGTRVGWNAPRGGFFLVLTVPFRADDALLEHSAREHGVLWTPMRHFYEGESAARQVRLSYSLLTPERIELGLDRLAALVREQGG
ncbi:PLP-dependent aminotransferase family protein [Streptomyces sp. S07_1.15]|uniref:aminotransferase-like domain-containing protein n=1 Tax=Streptomyces sp. S07_1.15 TaxID=2873925 RepID=UPI001D15BDD2|nr:PLP-dependent aminotransferase family protein [Streptomyces sp. S07_1.15]MCC3650538.1 PLP-dependent aminotransferase family protein [Streptomyces sp. S07_1.15]